MLHPANTGPTRGDGQADVSFAIFDWLDSSAPDAGAVYEQRLRLVERAERLGFRAYHLAEHHGTPLGLAPSPHLFLAAVAARTGRLRLGPLVTILPLYHPVRLVEEVAMLDQLSGGRLELGVGRGAAPDELAMFGVDAAETEAMFDEALRILLMGLRAGEIRFAGRYYTVDQASTSVRPAQRPYPPLWYPTVNPARIPWVAKHGFSFLDAFVSLLRDPGWDTAAAITAYERSFAEHRDDPDRLDGHVAAPRRGFVRHVVVAETDRQAEAIARRAYTRFVDHFNAIWLRRRGRAMLQLDYDTFAGSGMLLAGSPARVGDQLGRQLAHIGGNYFASVFAFGDIAERDALRSVELFGRQVIPGLVARSRPDLRIAAP